jgi:hypothetical protein
MNPRLIVAVIAGTFVFTVAVAVAVFWLLGETEKSTRHAATQFAAALGRNDPSAAPPGGSEYVGGVRAYFGPVTSAKVIETHNKSINTGNSADTRSYFVAEILLRSERGAAVIELEFDNHSFTNSSEKVSAVYEMEPDDVPGDALRADDRQELARAFAARGGKPADAMTLSHAIAELPKTGAPVEISAPVVAPASQARQSDAMKRLRCVQNANGDVKKLGKCSEPR